MMIDESIITTEAKQSLGKFLLKSKDYMIVRTKAANYLFLSDTLRYFKITDPSIEEYLRLCNVGNADDTYLSEDEIRSIGTFLTKKENAASVSLPDSGHDFLILNLTGGCNLACKYCFAEITKSYQTMTFDVARKAILTMMDQKNDCDEYSIYFFGGEPLMKKELVRQIAEYAYQVIVQEQCKKVKFLINTNATLIDDVAVQLFKQYNFTVTVSLDGPMAYHDRNRVYHSGKGSFEKVMKGVESLKNKDISANLRATFSPDTQDLVSNFMFFESLELPYSYSFTINSEYKLNMKETFFEEDQFGIVDRELRKVMDYFHTKIRKEEPIYYTGLNQKLSVLKYKQKRTYSCEAGRKSLTVDEQGNYFACQNMIPYKQAIMGNVDAGISEDKKNRFRSKDLELLTDCHNCLIRNLCAGGCEVERINPNKKMKRQMCRLFHIEWKNLLYLYALLMETKKK